MSGLQMRSRHHPSGQRHGTIAGELMVVGPAVALLTMAVSGAAGTSGLVWSTVAVLLFYSAFRLSGELIRAR